MSQEQHADVSKGASCKQGKVGEDCLAEAAKAPKGKEPSPIRQQAWRTDTTLMMQ